MRSICLTALTVLIALFAGGEPVLAQQVLKSGDVITGTIRLVKTRHPNGTPILAYQLVTPKPYTRENDDFCDKDQPLTTFHLVAMDDKKRADELKRSVGKIRSVKVVEPFCSETAWHIGDVVVFDWQFVPAP